MNFPKEGIQFLQELAIHNDREWFGHHKPRYDQYIREDGQLFFDALCKGIGSIISQNVDGKIFRIHRDVRFSKDKTPYSPHLRMSFKPAGNDCSQEACFFLSIEPDSVVVGTGIWEFNKEQLLSFRTKVDELDNVIASVGNIRIPEPELARIPKGFVGDSEHLRRKGFTAWIDRPWDGDDVEVNDCLDAVRRLKPIYDWLIEL